MRCTALFSALTLFAMTTGVFAQSSTDIPALSEEKTAVLSCLGTIESEATNWAQCMGLLFAPCAAQTVGSEEHLACLLVEREAWLASVEREQARTISKITSEGGLELTQIMSQWYGYVGNKCAAVAADKDGMVADAAYAGCEMSEIASVVRELKSCSDGRSTSPYCVIQE